MQHRYDMGHYDRAPVSANARAVSPSANARASPGIAYSRSRTPPLRRHPDHHYVDYRLRTSENHSDSGPARLADHRSDPEPLHTSAAARLQHDIAQAVAISATMHPEPVGQPVSFSRNPAQLTYWKQLFLELSGRRQSLNPAEELHLHLLTELLCLHQQSVERGRALDRTHMQQAAEILEAIKPGTHASKPIAIPSQSPAPQASGQQDIVARQPAPAPSASRVTRNDAKLRDGIQMAHTWFEKRQNPVPSVNEVTSPRSPRRLLSIPTPTMMISPFMIRPMTQTLDQCTARHRRLTQERGRLPLQKARKSRPQDLPPGAVLQAQGMTPMCRLRKSPL